MKKTNTTPYSSPIFQMVEMDAADILTTSNMAEWDLLNKKKEKE